MKGTRVLRSTSWDPQVLETAQRLAPEWWDEHGEPGQGKSRDRAVSGLVNWLVQRYAEELAGD